MISRHFSGIKSLQHQHIGIFLLSKKPQAPIICNFVSQEVIRITGKLLSDIIIKLNLDARKTVLAYMNNTAANQLCIRAG